ncbi:MAG: SDR family oxidoreductase [Bacteroidetes bacterium]|nr:SDR family oxidoreductase [Bacteroidota bacterium]
MKKYALVCGSTQGIGLSIAKKLAKNGVNIILMARNEAKLKACVSELTKSEGQSHTYLVADFSDPRNVQKSIASFLSGHSTGIDILINNTGGPKAGTISDARADDFIAAFNQHLICNHVLMQAVTPYMKSNQWGRIINIISTSVKQPLPNLGVSNTIRGAVANWSKTLSNELGRYNITVNNVLPGATNTDRLQSIALNKSGLTAETVEGILNEMASESPMKRIAEPEEIAAAVAFLASDEASYINGINLPVDGGRTKSL